MDVTEGPRDCDPIGSGTEKLNCYIFLIQVEEIIISAKMY